MGFLGIAFEMGAVDAGMGKASKSATKNLDKINKLLDAQIDVIKDLKKQFEGMTDEAEDFGDEAEDAANKSGGAFKKLGDGIKSFSGKFKKAMGSVQNRVMQFNVANIAQNMKSLTGESGNLTNSLEATMTSMMQTTKPIAAQLDLSSAEMKKFASRAAGMAYGMNTSADAVAETMKAIHVANKGAKASMSELGMSTKDWVKVVQTTNVPMQDYTAILGDMTTSWGASPKEAAKMLDQLMAIGKAAGTGTGAVKNAKVQLDELGEVFKSLPPSMARSSEEITSLMESSAKMSGVFRQMGDTQEEAISKANTVAKMFAEQSVAVEKALAIGDDRAISENPLIMYLTRLGIGFDEARDIVATGSRDAVAGMQRINDVYAKFGSDASPQVQRALSGLSAALGEGAAGLSYLAQNTTQGTEALAEMAKVSVDGSGALKKFGKDAYSSGLTLQETYDRAREAFDTTIRSIARKNVVGLVQKQIAGMREAGKEIRALGSDETWGPFVNALSQFRQMGISGLFASMAQSAGIGAKNSAKFGAKVGLLMDTFGQLGNEIAPVMQMLGMFGPGGIIAGGVGIAGLLTLEPSDRKKILGPFADTFEGIKATAQGLLDRIDFKELWEKLKDGFSRAFEYAKMVLRTIVDSGVVDDIVDGLSKAFGYVAEIIPWQRVIDGFVFVVQKMSEALAKVDWEKVAGGLVEAFKAILPSLVTFGREVLSGIFKAIKDEFGTEGQIAAALIGIAATAGGAFMGALAGPGGLVALAGLAGVAIGAEIASHLSGGGVSGRGYGTAEGLEKWSEETLVFGVAEDMEEFEKKAEDLKAAIKYEKEEAWDPMGIATMAGGALLGPAGLALAGLAGPDITGGDVEMVEKMETQLGRIEEAKREVFAERQRYAIEDLGDVAEGLMEMHTIMTPEEAEGVLYGGQTTGEQFVEGLTESLKKGKEQIAEDAGDATSSLTVQSPIEYGPLSGEGASNAAYRGGYTTMEQFALGVTDSTDMVRMAVEDALDSSVILALDTYAVKMRELASQRTFLADVARSMVRDISGANIEAEDPEANVNVKKSFQAAMSLPGLAAVVLAVTNEGAATRKMLRKIYDENVKQTTALDGMWGSREPGAPPTGAAPTE